MKKSLIALAALATVATAAQAQSSVEIYGVLDLGYASMSNVGSLLRIRDGVNTADARAGKPTERVSGMQNGGLSTSRLGFRGTEDLGGGLKAKFNLEAEILADNGTQSSTADSLFARASWVGLEGSVGQVKLGRMNTLMYDEGARLDPMGGGNFVGYIAAGQYGYARLNNAVTYLSPVVNGFQFGAQTGTRTNTFVFEQSAATYQFSEVAGITQGNRNNSAQLKYAAGPIDLSLTYAEQKDAAGVKLDAWTQAIARYTYEGIKFTVGYAQKDVDIVVNARTNAQAAPTSSEASKVTVTFIGVNAPIKGTNFAVNGMVQQIDSKISAGDTKPVLYSLGTTYSLSKRTTLYGLLGKSNQDNGSAQAMSNGTKNSYQLSTGETIGGLPAVAGVNQTGYMVGIRHTF